jgi:hypothetical protein
MRGGILMFIVGTKVPVRISSLAILSIRFANSILNPAFHLTIACGGNCADA